MKKAKQLLSLILCAVLLVGVLCACKNNNSDDNGSTTEAETVISSNEAVQNVLSQSVPEPDLTNAVKITLSDSNIKIEGNGAQEKDGSIVCTGKDGKDINIDCDSVISCAGYIPAPLAEKSGNVHLVGDCLAIGNLRSVVWRAYDVAMKI